mmetsp:Transcript_36493/g.86419  ORF Transcript_36493/g.86419 Transcript_36493/m.86419 type:complete len:410 (+) Transcript_36493:74-1303(+)
MERVAVSGNELSYTVTAEGEDVGVIQATKPLTPEKPFFEVTVVDGGTQSWIGVGLADTKYPLDKQPGWDQSSIGYHADDGMMYRSPIPDEMSKSGRPFPMPLTGKPFPVTTGDKIGVGVEFDDKGKEASKNPRRVFFSKNGVYLGSVLLERQYNEAMYPTVGFNSPGAKATVDFDASSASVALVHAAQFFGTNNYALDIAIEKIGEGADLNIQDTAGRTPLHMASAYGASPIATLLLQKGADPDIQDNMGLTPLHMSAGYVRPSTAKILIENGADPELRTQRNERPLDLIRNLRNATSPSSMGGLVTDKRYPAMTEIVELMESVTEDLVEWVVPPPAAVVDPKAEGQMAEAMEKAKKMVEEMKADPEKRKELEQAMALMQDKDFQEKVKLYAQDPEGMQKLIEEYKDKV